MTVPDTKPRIGLIAFELGVVPDYEDVRSAHIQIPVSTAERMKHDCDILFFTNKLKNKHTLPTELKHTEVIVVPDPRVRSDEPVMHSGRDRNSRVSLIKLGLLLYQLIRLKLRHNLSVLHFFGSNGVGYLAAAIKIFLPGTKIVWTAYRSPGQLSRLRTRLLSTIDSIVVHTRYVSAKFQDQGLNSEGYSTRHCQEASSSRSTTKSQSSYLLEGPFH